MTLRGGEGRGKRERENKRVYSRTILRSGMAVSFNIRNRKEAERGSKEEGGINSRSKSGYLIRFVEKPTALAA